MSTGCIWPDCGHDTNQSDPTPGCNGKFCPAQQKKRKEEVKAEYGNRAQVVTPYKPNRKQRRAQASVRKDKKDGR